MIIPLAPLLPTGSSDLPESSDGLPSNALLFGLAPSGVCLAPDVTTGTGELLPHRFTLTSPPAEPISEAVCFLWHSPPRHRDWVLPSTPPFGARTFLRPRIEAGDHLPCSKFPTVFPFIKDPRIPHNLNNFTPFLNDLSRSSDLITKLPGLCKSGMGLETIKSAGRSPRKPLGMALAAHKFL
jgi:hypothetical protein